MPPLKCISCYTGQFWLFAGKHNLVQYKILSFSIIFENKGLVLQGAGSCNDTCAYLQWRGEHLQQAWEEELSTKLKIAELTHATTFLIS